MTDQDPAGSTQEPQAPTAPARGVRVLAAEEFSLAEAIGGWRGMVESAAPGLVFVVVFLLGRDLTWSIVLASAVALLAVVVRLVQRTPLTQAFSGLLGVGIGVVWAWQTGEAQDYYAWGLAVNAAWAAGALLSVLLRWPAVGVLVSLLRGDDMSWRTAPEHGALRRRYVLATWLWVGLFGARLAVQVPLYLQGEDAVGWLGSAKLAMGLPLFALGLWLTWLLVVPREDGAERPGRRPRPRR